MTTIFARVDKFSLKTTTRAIFRENSCHFVNLLSLANNYSFSAQDKSSDLRANNQKVKDM